MKRNISGNSLPRIKVIAVVGPTASGKSDFAVDLALQMNGEVISADSRLVYKGFDIGAAKPTKEEMRGVRHHLIDIAEPEEDFSAGLWEKHAKAAIEDIILRGKTPIIAGGTGLYFGVLLENRALPKFEPDYALRAQLQRLSSLQLHDRLRELDENAAMSIGLHDRKKLIRTIEIAINTGRAMRQVKAPEFDTEWIGLNLPRRELYEKIERRADLILENGLIKETRALLAKHGRVRNIVETIGYREIAEYLDGAATLEQAVTKLKQNTRNYAKRQLTWFRKNPLIKWNVEPERL